MGRYLGSSLGCVLIATSTVAMAAEPVVQPIQVGVETVRYDHGIATVDLEKARGAVQVTPLPMDHGSLSFEVAVWNKADRPSNIDGDSFAFSAGSEQLPVLSRETLEKKAKNRAMWAQIAIAAVGGLSAAALANQRDYYHSTLVTPHGTYHASFSAPSTSGQIAAGATVAATAVGIAAVQTRLDQTRAALGEHIVQLTTIDPQDSYAGRVVVTKIKARALPQRVDLIVHWNGEDFPFAFQMAAKGTKAPIFTALTPPPPPLNPPPSPMPAAAAITPSVTPISAAAAPTTR